MTDKTPHPAAVEFFGSEEAARAYGEMIGQLHEFARVDGAPLGVSVTDWFGKRHDQYADYFARRRRGEAEQASGGLVSRNDYRVDPEERRRTAATKDVESQ